MITYIIFGILFIIFTLLLIFCVNIILAYKRLSNYNQSPLIISTFDNLDSPYHPSVLFFKDGWNGWKYWMAETPFSFKCKPYVDRNECPSIHVSNDGINWLEPKGLKNPLVNFGEEGEKNLDYYSDPHLLFNGNEIECWYRLTERHGDVNHRSEVSLRRIKTNDGINWSNEEIISQLNENEVDSALGQMVVSPALIYKGHQYLMWYVDSEDKTGAQRNIRITRSNDGVNWHKSVICRLSGREINPWHIDVQFIDNTYWLVIYTDDNEEILLLSSTDGQNFKYVKTTLTRSLKIGSFYSFGLYRSCLVKTDSDYRLYFSAHDYNKTYLGLMSGPSPIDMTISSDRQFRSIMSIIKPYVLFKFKKEIFLIRNYRQVIKKIL